jgi:hypothetical protein
MLQRHGTVDTIIVRTHISMCGHKVSEGGSGPSLNLTVSVRG